MENIKTKFNEIIQKIITVVKPKLIIIDTKMSTIFPNPKMKKILYITVGSLFGFMFLIIVLGLLLSPLRNQQTDTGTKLNKPNIVSVSPEPQKELSQTQKDLLNLETKVKEMTFPQSELNIPVIENDIKI